MKTLDDLKGIISDELFLQIHSVYSNAQNPNVRIDSRHGDTIMVAIKERFLVWIFKLYNRRSFQRMVSGSGGDGWSMDRVCLGAIELEELVEWMKEG